MLVIGKVKNDEYICTISHIELEKFLGLYYGGKKTIEVGEEINLGIGYDYVKETESAMRKTEEIIKSNKDIITAIMNGIMVIGNKTESEVK